MGISRDIRKIAEHLKVIEAVLNVHTEAFSVMADAQSKTYALLLKIQARLEPPPAVALVITLGGDIRKVNDMLQVADTGSVLAELTVEDSLHNPGAKLDSIPAWSLSDADFGKVNASEDGMSAVVVLSGKLGKFKVLAAAKAGEKDLSAESDEVEVVVGAAAFLKVALSAK